MSITAELIARKAGCSTATVSRVLNETAPVSRETERAVRRVIEELGEPVRRRSRRTGNGDRQSGLIEVVFHLTAPIERMDIVNGRIELGPIAPCPPDRFFTPENYYSNTHSRRIIDGAVDEMARWRQRPVLRTTNRLDDPQLLADISSADMHGLILLGHDGPAVAPFLKKLKFPCVSLISQGRDGSASATSDDLPGMRQAVEHLRRLGHTRIGYISCHRHAPAFAERLTAFKVAMTEAGLPVASEWLFDESIHVAHIEADARRILAQVHRPSAIICSYDGAAVGVMRAARSLGIDIPTDLSLIGFGNHDIVNLTQPALTSINAPNYEIGRVAVKLLMMERHQPESTRGLCVRLATHLVERHSTAPARQGRDRRRT